MTDRKRTSNFSCVSTWWRTVLVILQLTLRSPLQPREWNFNQKYLNYGQYLAGTEKTDTTIQFRTFPATWYKCSAKFWSLKEASQWVLTSPLPFLWTKFKLKRRGAASCPAGISPKVLFTCNGGVDFNWKHKENSCLGPDIQNTCDDISSLIQKEFRSLCVQPDKRV